MTVHRDTLEDLVRRAIAEDVGRGDITSDLTVDAGAKAEGTIIAKSDLTVSGLEVVRKVFETGDVSFAARVAEGARASSGSVLAEVRGEARALLASERVALNLLMRLSGIATLTAEYVAAVEGTGARIADTRKTTPGLRALEKAAVRAGGGVNHRSGLDDGILIKDNHVALAGGVAEAVRRAKSGAPHLLKVEVEVEDGAQLSEALEAGADAILLDNISPEAVREAVKTIRARRPEVVVEVSGNVALDTVRAYAEAGPDLISAGEITHSAVAADVSLDISAGERP